MAQKPKPDLSEHEDESVPLDDVLRTLLKAKPSHAKEASNDKGSKKRDEQK